MFACCLPACLLACLPACLLACLPACLLACLPACLLACLPACLLACFSLAYIKFLLYQFTIILFSDTFVNLLDIAFL